MTPIENELKKFSKFLKLSFKFLSFFLEVTFLKPTRERGILCGLSVFSWVCALLSLLPLLDSSSPFPQQKSIGPTLTLSALAVTFTLLYVFTPHPFSLRKRSPLPGRHRMR